MASEDRDRLDEPADLPEDPKAEWHPGDELAREAAAVARFEAEHADDEWEVERFR